MENLTIIIPTNNRPSFIRRSIKYWNNYNIPLIIVDGSNETQKKWMDENSNENIKYFYKKISFPERLKLAGKLIKTKYAILLSDDEFYSVNALKKCVNFLELNNEYVAVNGRAVGFYYKNNKLVGKIVYKEWAGRMRVEEDPKERIISHHKNFVNPLGVSVIKSSLWSKCANLYANNEFPIFAQWEILINLILSFAGKSKTLDVLMYFRSLETETPSIPSTIKNHIPSLNIKNQIQKIWFETKHEKLKINFINVTSNFLASLKPEFSLDYCKEALIQSMDNYVIRINKKKKNNILISLKNSKKLVIIINFIIRFLYKFGLYKYKKLMSVINSLEAQGVEVNHRDLNQIILSLNHSKKKIK